MCVVVYFRHNLETSFLTCNVLLILIVRVVIFYACKTHNPRFLEFFRGAKAFLTPKWSLMLTGRALIQWNFVTSSKCCYIFLYCTDMQLGGDKIGFVDPLEHVLPGTAPSGGGEEGGRRCLHIFCLRVCGCLFNQLYLKMKNIINVE